MITVFTPTYNRARLLPRLYESLCRQTYRDFEWIVVDDGSTDNTKNVVSKLKVENGKLKVDDSELKIEECETDDGLIVDNSQFSIRYFYQENGGKHRAINRGVKEANGELFFIADSDDALPPNALGTVADIYEEIKDDNSFAGVCGLDGTFEGEIIGSGILQDKIDDNSITVRFNLGITGDMKEVFRTNVLKDFPFPDIEGERFCPEVLVWNRIATKYKLRFFNQIVYWAEYQKDGISAGIVKARMNSPIASMMTYAELTVHKGVPTIAKIKAAINYWRFRFCSDNEKNPQLSWWYHWTMPLGFLMHLRDLKTVK